MPESETKTSEQQDVPASEKFSRERLIAEAPKLLGLRSFVVAGALHNVRGSGDMTIDQVKSAVDKYHQKEA